MAISVPTFEPSKTALERVSEETRDQVLNSPHGMFDYLRINNPDHILVSGKRANQLGTILYGFEHLGREVHAAELASQLGLAEKQVTNAISKINQIIYPVFGMKIERQRVDRVFTGKLNITSLDDAIQAREVFTKAVSKRAAEFGSTIASFKNNGGDIDALASAPEMTAVMSLVGQLAPCLPPAQADEA